MMERSNVRRFLAVAVSVTVGMAFLAPLGSRAQEVDERAQIEKLIEKRVAMETEKQFDPKRIAERLNFGWPVKPPAMTRADVQRKIDKAVVTAVDKKHPMSRLEEIKKEAEEKYGLYKSGDKVSFVIRGGLGPNTHVEGWLREITDDRVCVGSRWIPRTDMTKEDLARFDADISKEKIERYVTGRTRHFHAVREQFEKQARKVLTPPIYQAGGYVNVRGQWATRQEIFAHVAKVEKSKLRKSLTKELTEKLYKESGYVFNAQTGEWQSKSALEKVSGGIASLFGGGGDEEPVKPVTPDPGPAETTPEEPTETEPAIDEEADPPEGDEPGEDEDGESADGDTGFEGAGDDEELSEEELAELGEIADDTMGGGGKGLGLTLLVVFALGGLGAFVFIAYCLSLICRKAGSDPGILVWIPVLQIIPLFSAADLPSWMIVLLFVPVVNIAVPLLLWWKLCEARGKPAFLGLLMIVPGVNLLLILYLAFSGPSLGDSG